jgi:hypothetical protein
MSTVVVLLLLLLLLPPLSLLAYRLPRLEHVLLAFSGATSSACSGRGNALLLQMC